MPARFECPRCQTVFIHEKGDDDSFVECPSCGALAMSAGEATGVDSDALARALSSSHDAPTHLQAKALESTENEHAPVPSSSPGSASDPVPADAPSSSRDAVGGAGVFSGLLAPDAPRGEDAPPPPVETDAARGAPPSAVAEVTDPGAARPPKAAAEASLDLGLEEELGDFALPTTTPSPAISPQKKRPERKPAVRAASTEPQPTKPAVLEEQGVDLAAALGEGAGLSEDAIGALEAAFDTLAARPAPRRGADGLSAEERAFLRGEVPAKEPPRAPPLTRRPPVLPAERPPPRRAQPPPRRKERPAAAERPRGLSLSAEAREAAFLPLHAAPARPAVETYRAEGRETSRAALVESTVPQGQVPPRAVERSPGRAEREPPAPRVVVDAVAEERAPPPREAPRVMSGVGLMLVVAVFVGLGAGAGVGVLTAPPHVQRNDARARAELQLAEGNRFYEAGRFDDALGKYKAAVSIDRAFALAHRAKGAALAKQQRWDEAAEAYKEYLGLERDAIDAADVREALARRGIVVDAPASPPAASAPSAPSPPAATEAATQAGAGGG